MIQNDAPSVEHYGAYSLYGNCRRRGIIIDRMWKSWGESYIFRREMIEQFHNNGWSVYIPFIYEDCKTVITNNELWSGW